MLAILEESPRFHAAIRVVNREAFGGEEEVRLVDRLRQDGLIVTSLVAREDRQVVGHVLFSDLRIDTAQGVLLAAALAPLAVLPGYRRRGIGSELVSYGLEACREKGRVAAIVVGDYSYYSRFGFSWELARNLISPYSKLGTSWMALELEPDALENVQGIVRYPPAFTLIESH